MTAFKYFTTPFTEASLKTQFRDQSKKLHPDAGGDAEKFAEMRKEFDAAVKLAARGAGRKVLRGQRKKAAPAPVFSEADKKFIRELLNFAKDEVKSLAHAAIRKIHRP